MNFGIYQSRALPPKVDGKQNGSHNRVLFREQHDRNSQYDTVTVFLSDEHLQSVVEQGLEQLPDELVDAILEKFSG